MVEGKGIDLRNDVSFVTAQEIKQFTGKTEPRILAKMDTEDDLPDVFRRSGVFVLPIDRRTYAIVHGSGYHNTEQMNGASPTIHEATLPLTLIEMAEKGPTSEGRYLEHAYNTGLLERFLDVKPLFGYLSGRTITPQFSFFVGGVKLEVKGAQIELDRAYVDGGQIVIAEAKIGIPRSFIIRQLYYPFRTYSAQEPNRAIRTILFAYDNQAQTYNLWEYRFTDPSRYNSIELVKSGRFRFQISPPDPKHFETTADLTDAIPQADDLRKVMELPVQVAIGRTDSHSMAGFFGFTERQSSYYRQAAEMLGLVKLEGKRYSLTKKGQNFVGLGVPDRNRTMTEILFTHPIMQEVLKRLISHPNTPVSRKDIVAIIAQNSKLTGTTPPRRAQTILSWFKWVQSNFGLVIVKEEGVWLARSLPSLSQYS